MIDVNTVFRYNIVTRNYIRDKWMEEVIDVLINVKNIMKDGSLITITHFYFMLGISMVASFFLTISIALAAQQNGLVLNLVYFILITLVFIMAMMLMMAFTLSYQEVYSTCQ